MHIIILIAIIIAMSCVPPVITVSRTVLLRANGLDRWQGSPYVRVRKKSSVHNDDDDSDDHPDDTDDTQIQLVLFNPQVYPPPPPQ